MFSYSDCIHRAFIYLHCALTEFTVSVQKHLTLMTLWGDILVSMNSYVHV